MAVPDHDRAAAARALEDRAAGMEAGIATRNARVRRMSYLADMGRRGLRRLSSDAEAMGSALTAVEDVAHVAASDAADLHDSLAGLQRAFTEVRAERERLARDMEAAELLIADLGQAGRAVRLLSFTAAIEAARAGEAGQAFGVLARRMQDLGTRCEDGADALHGGSTDMIRRLSEFGARASQLGDELAHLPRVAGQLSAQVGAIATGCVAVRSEREHIATGLARMHRLMDRGFGGLAVLRQAATVAVRTTTELVELARVAAGIQERRGARRLDDVDRVA